MKPHRSLLVLLLGCAALPAAAQSDAPPSSEAPARPRLLVPELQAQGVPAEQAAALTDALVQALEARGLFQVLSRKDVQALLSAERQRQLLGGCSEGGGDCAQNLGQALTARFVLSGALSQLGDTLQLTLEMLDTVKGERVGRASRLAGSLEVLRAQLPYAAAEASGSPLPPPPSRVLPYGLMGAGALSLVAGGVSGMLALSRGRVLSEELCPGGTQGGTCSGQALRPRAYYLAEEAALGRERTVALGLVGLGVGLGVLGFVLNPPPEGGPRVALVPTASGVGLAGVLP